jgi:hypothetical protein
MEVFMTRKRTSTEEPTPTTTEALEMPASDTNGNSESFAERVGQRERPSFPDPFGMASDTVAGVRLFESRQDRQMAIKFGEGRPEDKPSQPVIDKMKEAGYRWNPTHKIWAHPVRPDSSLTTRIDAERLFQDVRQMIRKEKGLDMDGQHIPF